MEIKVKGHSGCSIDIVTEGISLYIVKSTVDKTYIDRLCKQALKQQEASLAKMQHIRVPHIFEIKKTKALASMKMEYVYSKNFIDYFESYGFEQVDYFIKAIRIFLDYEISHSGLQSVSSLIVKKKFEDVKRRIMSNVNIEKNGEIDDILRRSEEIFSSMKDSMEIPIGICHGDLTFSNILFNGNNYYLIDFLDSFIESPLMDMVKLKQDSEYKWSLLMYTGNYDSVRFRITCETIDAELESYFSQFKWYSSYYHYFQLMNFLRILQYAKEDKVIFYLKNCIKKLLYHE